MFSSLGLSDDDDEILLKIASNSKRQKRVEPEKKEKVEIIDESSNAETEKLEKPAKKTDSVDVIENKVKEEKTSPLFRNMLKGFGHCPCCGSDRYLHDPQKKNVGGKYFKKILDPNDETSIPYFIDFLFDEILEKHINEIGLFRRNGSKELIKELEEIVDDEDEEDLEASETFEALELDPHSYCGFLKHYFKSMKEPLIPYDLYERIIECGRDFQERTTSRSSTNEKLRFLIIKELPKSNFILMKKLAEFLNKVGENSKKNLMTFENLGIVFGPILVKTKVLDLSCLQDDVYNRRVMKELISNPNYFFRKI